MQVTWIILNFLVAKLKKKINFNYLFYKTQYIQHVISTYTWYSLIIQILLFFRLGVQNLLDILHS